MRHKLFSFVDTVASLAVWGLIGVITIVFVCFLIVFVFFIPFDTYRKKVHPVVSAWAKTIMAVCPLMRVRVEGEGKLQKTATYVYIVNHQSLADILVTLYLKEPFKFIAKRELFMIPFFGWGMYLSGYIPLARGNPKSSKRAMERARKYLKNNVSVMFFPEGTRSPDGEIQDFKIGAFKLSAELGIPVVPMVIDGTHNLLPKGSRLLRKRVNVRARICSPFKPCSNDFEAIDRLMRQVRSEMIDTLKKLRSA